MKNTNRTALWIAIALLWLAGGCSQSDNPVGKWRMMGVPPGKVAADSEIELLPDGKIGSNNDRTAPSQWRVNGQELTISGKTIAGKPVYLLGKFIDGNHLELNYINGQLRRYERVYTAQNASQTR